MQLKLGKTPPTRDPRTLKLADYLDTFTLPPPPPTLDLTRGRTDWGMMGNDQYGDCTCAAAGHLIQEWTANAGNPAEPQTAEILAAYAAITGFNPVTGANDNGANMLDVLKYWKNTGIAGHKIGAFASVHPSNIKHAIQAMYLFEGLYIGLALPLSAQSQNVWDVPPTGLQGNGQPGSWGGHAVCPVKYKALVAGYTDAGPVIVTWGGLKQMTWAFFTTYCDEAYAILSADLFNVDGKSLDGFDLATLQKDLSAVGSVPRSAVAPVIMVLVGGGFTETVNDGSPIWDIADQLDAIPGVQTIRRAWSDITAADVEAANVVLVYSWGCAEFWHQHGKLSAASRPTLEHLFIIAGVPNFMLFEFYGSLWSVPSNVKAATAFNIDTFPISCGIHNPSAVYINVDCNGPAVTHSNIPALPSVQAPIVAAVKALVGA